MPDQYDTDKPTERWVRIGYAVTSEGRIDKARIGRPELLPVAEAKRLVDNHHGQYLTDEQVAEEQAKTAELAQVAGATVALPDDEEPPVGWGGAPAPTPVPAAVQAPADAKSKTNRAGKPAPDGDATTVTTAGKE